MKCATCGKEKTSWVERQGGIDYAFCSLRCRREFRDNHDARKRQSQRIGRIAVAVQRALEVNDRERLIRCYEQLRHLSEISVEGP